jgi:large subunit ribosomal protein L14
MIKIGTKLLVVDNSGAKLAKCIKLMGKQKISVVGNLISVTLSNLKNSKKVKKRIIYLGLIVGTSY